MLTKRRVGSSSFSNCLRSAATSVSGCWQSTKSAISGSYHWLADTKIIRGSGVFFNSSVAFTSLYAKILIPYTLMFFITSQQHYESYAHRQNTNENNPRDLPLNMWEAFLKLFQTIDPEKASMVELASGLTVATMSSTYISIGYFTYLMLFAATADSLYVAYQYLKSAASSSATSEDVDLSQHRDLEAAATPAASLPAAVPEEEKRHSNESTSSEGTSFKSANHSVLQRLSHGRFFKDFRTNTRGQFGSSALMLLAVYAALYDKIKLEVCSSAFMTMNRYMFEQLQTKETYNVCLDDTDPTTCLAVTKPYIEWCPPDTESNQFALAFMIASLAATVYYIGYHFLINYPRSIAEYFQGQNNTHYQRQP